MLSPRGWRCDEGEVSEGARPRFVLKNALALDSIRRPARQDGRFGGVLARRGSVPGVLRCGVSAPRRHGIESGVRAAGSLGGEN